MNRTRRCLEPTQPPLSADLLMNPDVLAVLVNFVEKRPCVVAAVCKAWSGQCIEPPLRRRRARGFLANLSATTAECCLRVSAAAILRHDLEVARTNLGQEVKPGSLATAGSLLDDGVECIADISDPSRMNAYNYPIHDHLVKSQQAQLFPPPSLPPLPPFSMRVSASDVCRTAPHRSRAWLKTTSCRRGTSSSAPFSSIG